jgi:hypothetical protein
MKLRAEAESSTTARSSEGERQNIATNLIRLDMRRQCVGIVSTIVSHVVLRLRWVVTGFSQDAI